MPRLVRRIPRYSKHRASGQAVVTLSGQDFYLGPHGSKVSKLEYDRVIAEWLARGRRSHGSSAEDGGELTIVELIVAYKRFAYSSLSRPRFARTLSCLSRRGRPGYTTFRLTTARRTVTFRLEQWVELGNCKVLRIRLRR